jgi:hypothetical protein
VEGDIADLPNDVDALKAALTVERARIREVVAERDAGAAELAVARAKASEDLALIAHPQRHLAGYAGLFQADAFDGYRQRLWCNLVASLSCPPSGE